MPTVYVVQNQHTLDKATETLVPRFDVKTAEKYGELFFLLSPNAKPYRPDLTIPTLQSVLKNFTDEDYVLMVGNHSLCAFALAIAADVNDGRVKVLQWNGYEREYSMIQVENLFFEME